MNRIGNPIDHWVVAGNESISYTISTNGSTFRMEADQEPNHPGFSIPSVSVEGCGTEDLNFTFGFVNIFAQDDGNAFVDIDCRQNIGAYDPNDKQGFPLGIGDRHYIERDQDIEYLIRFQNTGTDTAFNVVIRDTISQYLDLTKIRPGAASHAYDFDISNDRVLSFNFDNIMLPDSNVNEVASHGFVKFKIAQQSGLALETEIHNRAAIFFDFNAPIITNETLHTIGENYLFVSIDPTPYTFIAVNASPNPFNEFTTIEVEGVLLNDAMLQLYDSMGRLVMRRSLNNNKVMLYKNDVEVGLYFFTIENDGVTVGSGKLIKK